MKIKHIIIYIGVAIAAPIVISCTRGTVFSHFEHTALTGWSRDDVLTFTPQKIEQSGTYDLTLMMRTTEDFPFQMLQVVVDRKMMPAETLASDTLNCHIVTEKGQQMGDGLNVYDNSFPVNTLRLEAGDSLVVTVRHNMRRDMIPGVGDVGITLQLRQ